MKINAICVPCLLNRVIYEAKLIDSELALKVMEESCAILGKYNLYETCSAVVASEVHRKTYDILGTNDPYREIKKRSNQTALSLLTKAEEYIDKSDDKLKAAIICSIAGNVLDFGIASSPESPEELVKTFDDLLAEGLGVDDTEKIKKYLGDGNQILLFTDNCGEVVFDKLLCRELKKFNIHLTLVVKGEPVLTDATMEDVKQLGMDEVVDEVKTTESYAVGLAFDKIPDILTKAIEDSALIIAKGMGNYEAFSETDYKPIAYLMRTKCVPVAQDMGLETGLNVAKLYE
jgi:uncharacterized protein with ATP-grasp and redox domains